MGAPIVHPGTAAGVARNMVLHAGVAKCQLTAAALATDQARQQRVAMLGRSMMPAGRDVAADRTSPSSHSPHGRWASARAIRCALCGGSSRLPHRLCIPPQPPFYHRHKRHHRLGSRSFGGWPSSSDAVRLSRRCSASPADRGCAHAASRAPAGHSPVPRPCRRPARSLPARAGRAPFRSGRRP